MPRNSWKSLRDASAAERAAPSVDYQLPPEIQRLYQERRQLEARMDELTGRTGAGQTDSGRYPVTPLTERRAADAQWARQRDLAEVTPRTRTDSQDSAEIRRPRNSGEPPTGMASPPLRTPRQVILQPAGRVRDGSVFEEPLSRSLYRPLRIPGDEVRRRGGASGGLAAGGRAHADASERRRDAGAEFERRFTGLRDRFTEIQDRFTSLPDRFTDVDTPTASAARRVQALTDRFTALLREPPRGDGLTERMRTRLGVRERLGERAGPLAEDPPLRSARAQYEARREELLALRTGGSGDLDDRSIRARARALARLKMERERQAADEARVESARARARMNSEVN